MSAVLECDTCHRHFSVNEKGWQEFVSRITDPKDKNAYNENAITRHLCKNCKPRDPDEPKPFDPEEFLRTLAEKLGGVPQLDKGTDGE